MSVDMQLTGVADLNRQLKKLSAAVADKKQKRKITKKAARPVVNAARRLAPRLRRGRKHHRYDTVKLVGRVRAPNGLGNKIATYLKGNLAGSIAVLLLRKTTTAIIGPRIKKGKNAKGTFGPGSRRFDGYYAQMVFGSALKFGQRVTRRALVANVSKSTKIVEKEISKVIKNNT